jgi:hypothetical protein
MVSVTIFYEAFAWVGGSRRLAADAASLLEFCFAKLPAYYGKAWAQGGAKTALAGPEGRGPAVW